MLIISTPIITKADLIEGSIINCVQCDIQIYMNMNEIKVRVTRSRKGESLRLHLLYITIDCICLLGSVTL